MNQTALTDAPLWTPQGAVHDGQSQTGINLETGGRTVCHFFTFSDKRSGKQTRVHILADAFMSKEQVEAMAGTAFESWLLELRDKESANVGKHVPSADERKDIGKAVREFRAYAAKRRESSNQKLYYPVG